MFSVLCVMIMGAIFTAFLCLVFDTKFDDDLGIALSGVAIMLSIPFAQFAFKFSD